MYFILGIELPAVSVCILGDRLLCLTWTVLRLRCAEALPRPLAVIQQPCRAVGARARPREGAFLGTGGRAGGS